MKIIDNLIYLGKRIKYKYNNEYYYGIVIGIHPDEKSSIIVRSEGESHGWPFAIKEYKKLGYKVLESEKGWYVNRDYIIKE